MTGTDETPPEHYAFSRISIAALAGYVVVTAALLVGARRYASEHPVTMFLELLGFPALIMLVFILRKRRRNESGTG